MRFLATAVTALLSGFSVSAVHVVSPQLAAVGLSDAGGGIRSHVLVYDHGRTRELPLRLKRWEEVDDVWLSDRRHIWVVAWNVFDVSARLLRTADGGRTWTSVAIPSHGAHAGASDTLQFLDREHGRLVVLEPTAPDARLYETSDGGSHWRLVARLPRSASVVFETPTRAWLGGGFFGEALWRSVDGGRHWRGVTPSAALMSTPGFPGGVGLVARQALHGRLAIYRRRRSGWVRVSSLPRTRTCPVPSASFPSPRVWWVAGAGVLYRTIDGGRHWLRAGRLRGAACPVSVIAASATVAWRLMVQDDRNVVSLTTDGGAHWRVIR